MGLTTRVIPAGGSTTLYPGARLAGVAGDGVSQGKITDQFGRQYHSPPSGIADYGKGTAPLIVGKVEAQTASRVWFDFE